MDLVVAANTEAGLKGLSNSQESTSVFHMKMMNIKLASNLEQLYGTREQTDHLTAAAGEAARCVAGSEGKEQPQAGVKQPLVPILGDCMHLRIHSTVLTPLAMSLLVRPQVRACTVYKVRRWSERMDLIVWWWESGPH
jgi:hypothetical protein